MGFLLLPPRPPPPPPPPPPPRACTCGAGMPKARSPSWGDVASRSRGDWAVNKAKQRVITYAEEKDGLVAAFAD